MAELLTEQEYLQKYDKKESLTEQEYLARYQQKKLLTEEEYRQAYRKKEKPKGLTYRPFANLRSLLRKPTTTAKKEQIGKVMERSKWEIGGLQQWTKGYWDAVSKGKIKEFQKLERRLSEEKRNPIDALEKVGWAGLAVSMGMTAGQMLEPAFVSAVAKIRPDLAKPIPTGTGVTIKDMLEKPTAKMTKEEIGLNLKALEKMRFLESYLEKQKVLRMGVLRKALEEVTVEAPQSSVQRVMSALRGAKTIRRAQETIYAKERVARLGKALAVGEKVKGEKGFYAELGELKGEFPKVQFESIRKQVTQADIDDLFIQVKRNPLLSEWDKITARKGLAKLFGEYGGTVPTEGELGLLNRVFGKEFTTTALRARPMLVKMRAAGLELANIPRAIMASFDLSFGFRQGIFLATRHPIHFTKAFLKQFPLFLKEKAFVGLQEAITKDPYYELAKKGKLSITELGKLLGRREERFMSSWAEKIPLVGRVVRASGRAYTGMANKLRLDVFKSLVKQAEKMGRNPAEDVDLLKGIANFVNCATGRGGLGALEKSATTLNAVFFSPRLTFSRLTLLNPVYYIRQDPFVRKEALKCLFSFVGAGLTTLQLAKLAGAEVGINPLSTDFGKIKIGNTRIDIWGGFQQYVVLAARLITGKAVSSTTGKVMVMGKGYRPLTRLDIIQRAIEYKEAPVFTFATSLLKGQTAVGEPVSVPKEAGKRFVPMAIQDIYDIMVDDPNLLPVSLLGIFGVGLQTYKGRGTAFSFKEAPRSGGKLKLGRKSSATGKLKLGK